MDHISGPDPSLHPHVRVSPCLCPRLIIRVPMPMAAPVPTYHYPHPHAHGCACAATPSGRACAMTGRVMTAATTEETKLEKTAMTDDTTASTCTPAQHACYIVYSEKIGMAEEMA